MEKHSIAIVTEKKIIHIITSHSCILKVIEEIKKLHPYLPEKIAVHLWTDGCASQFRSKFVFKLTTMFPKNYSVIRYYNERHHDKGPMDGVGGCVKNVVFRHVRSGKIVIESARAFAENADKFVKGITVLYLSSDEVLNEHEDVSDTPYVDAMSTLQVHMVKSGKTKAGFSYLHFVKIASDRQPFYTHWYGRLGDLTDSCGHYDIKDGYIVDETCALCLEGENGSSWICCPLCNQWFRDDYCHK